MTEAQTPVDPAANAGDGDAQLEAPNWFSAYADAQKKEVEALKKDLDKRFEGFRKKYVEPEPKDSAAPKPITAEDLSAARRFERVAARLPDEFREELDQVADERGFQDAIFLAERLAKTLPSQADEPVARATPRGKGASPAPNKAHLPKTQSEYLALRKRDPARADEISRHPDFDVRALPVR